MKSQLHIFGIILLGIVFTLNSCDELSELGIELTTPETSVEFLIVPIEDVGYQVIGTTTLSTDMDSLLSENGFGANDVGSIVVKNIQFDIIESSPDANATFDELETIDISIGADKYEKVSLAYVDSIPDGVRTLICKNTGMDYKDYLLSDEYDLTIAGSNKAPITNAMLVKVTFQFTIKILFSSITEEGAE